MSTDPPLSLTIPHELVEAIVDHVAERIAGRVIPRLSTLTDQEDRWLDSKEAAEYLGVSVPAIHRLTASRSLPFSQDRPRGRCYFRRSELDRWRDSNAQ
jgi:excisionase family DNA binding protein